MLQLNGAPFVATNMDEQAYTRILDTVAWAKTQNDRREVGILREDLFWALEQINELRFIQSDADLQHDLQNESRSWLQEVIE